MKKLRVTVEGKVYEVLVEMLDEATPAASAGVRAWSAPAPSPVPANPSPAAPAPAAAPAAKPAAGAGDIVSPLAGKLVSIDVTVGQAVAAGAQVATVEAMKMNTYVYATSAGTVAAVLAKPGDGVEEGTPLVRLG